MMIDLHNHILPGVDDGAATMEESLEIARQFVSEGVEKVAATPHFNPLEADRVSAADVVELVDSLRTALAAADIPLHVEPGQEIFLTPDLPALLASGEARPLGSSRWIVVELPFDTLPFYVDDTLFRLQSAGYRPILAHPERYSFVQRDPDKGVALAERDVALQLTAASLLGHYGRRVRNTAEKLLAEGAYSIASSDRHHPGQNRSLEAVRKALARLGGQDLAELLLQTNPRRVLANERLSPADRIESRQGTLFSWPFRA
ncbi:MAG TPA: CpsB/CapC family capsule biosynthesis tyrosine phosphatase [Chloroflexota bacterium]|nr:CpsB/CapC family capsule biosynthesis tyrosine phosphatase [Chloroflexota bacterium]